MKQLKSLERMLGGVVAGLAFLVAYVSVGNACSFIFYQPKMPDRVKELRRR